MLTEKMDLARLEEEIRRFVERLSWLWGQEPLDGDHTEEISRLVLGQLDERNGNVTAGEMERAGWRRCDLCWMWTQDMDSHVSRRHHAEEGLEAAS